MADYIITDLPYFPSDVSQAVIRCSNYVALVVEREKHSVLLGKHILELLYSWGLSADQVSAIVVTRMILPLSLKMEELKLQLGCEILGAIPYSEEACSMAQIKAQPIVVCKPDNIVADSIQNIADKLSISPTTAPLVQLERD